jgi:hypothetical protein
MLDGKMLRVATGMPIRNSALANMPLALAEPEPLTLAKRMTKSLSLSGCLRFVPGSFSVGSLGQAFGACSELRNVDDRLLHVPGAGGAALGAQTAVHADVFVLDHDAAGGQLAGDVQILVGVQRRRSQPLAQRPLPRRSR